MPQLNPRGTCWNDFVHLQHQRDRLLALFCKPLGRLPKCLNGNISPSLKGFGKWRKQAETSLFNSGVLLLASTGWLMSCHVCRKSIATSCLTLVTLLPEVTDNVDPQRLCRRLSGRFAFSVLLGPHSLDASALSSEF